MATKLNGRQRQRRWQPEESGCGGCGGCGDWIRCCRILRRYPGVSRIRLVVYLASQWPALGRAGGKDSEKRRRAWLSLTAWSQARKVPRTRIALAVTVYWYVDCACWPLGTGPTRALSPSFLGPHFGRAKTGLLVLGLAFRVGQDVDVAEYVRSCQMCQHTKAEHGGPRGLLHLSPFPSRRGGMIGVGPAAATLQVCLCQSTARLRFDPPPSRMKSSKPEAYSKAGAAQTTLPIRVGDSRSTGKSTVSGPGLTSFKPVWLA